MRNKLLFAIVIVMIVIGGYLLFSSQPKSESNISKTDNTSEPTADTQPNSGIPSSKKIILSNQNLQKIPDYVFKQVEVEELDVSNNQLSGAMQAEIRYLQNLKILDASNNRMTGVPAEIGQLQNLRILDLSNNQLTGLPYELGNLQKLQKLIISGNNYSELDLSIIVKKLPNTVQIIK